MRMTEILVKLAEQLNGCVFVLLGILVIVFILLFKAGKWTEKFFHHDKRMDKLEGMSDKVVKIETKVDMIYQLVNPNRTVASSSPIALTAAGKEIAQKINVDAIFDRYASQLAKQVETINPTNNAYDIQQTSMAVAKEPMLRLLDSNELTTIKQEAYARGMIIEDIMSIFGVYLRDYILKQKNIPVSEVDVQGKAKESV
jgi:hypothetical protein